MACACVACAISCTAIAAGKLDRAQANISAEHSTMQHESASGAHPVTKFILSDLNIEGDIHDRDGVRNRILKVSNGREYDNSQALADEAAVRIRGDFQERGYFIPLTAKIGRNIPSFR
jgi:hypothetical protein